ncbi:MAG: hypothetical protein ACE5OZ_26180 [Candidatus Heimdallarchaeota archaeon]
MTTAFGSFMQQRQRLVTTNTHQPGCGVAVAVPSTNLPLLPLKMVVTYSPRDDRRVIFLTGDRAGVERPGALSAEFRQFLGG